MTTTIDNQDWKIRKKAVNKLEDQQALVQVAKTDENENVRKAAIKKLKDEDALTWIAKNDSSLDLQELALKKLDVTKWQDFFAVLSKDPQGDERIRKIATKRLDTEKWQELLAEIASNQDNGILVRLEAISKLKDRELLSKLKQDNEPEAIKEKAGKTLKKLSGVIVHRISPF